MPTTVSNSKFKNAFPLPTGNSGHAFTFSVTTDTTAMGTGDIQKLIKLPAKGLTIVDAFVQSGDMDTNATPAVVFSLQVSNGTTTKTIIHQSTVGQAGGFIRPSKAAASEDGIGYTIPDDDYYLQFLFDTAAATAAAVACKVGISLSGFYEAGAVTE